MTERTFVACRIEQSDFAGWRSALLLRQVQEPLWVDFRGTACCVADSGYLWVQYFPDGVAHTVTSMFDRDGDIIQWYIDICAGWGIGSDGMPWFDDLYLDIVVTPSGDVELLDADELDAALAAGSVSDASYNHAWTEARRILQLIDQGRFPLIAQSLADVVDVRNTLSFEKTGS